jgi:ribonuclease E
MLSEGKLINIEMEGGGAASIKGNIYKARVSSTNTSLQAAFVEFGGEREGFLSIQDVGKPYLREGKVPDIAQVLKEGQEILVQVLKDPINRKGASLTTNVSLPGRYMVLVPHGDGIGVSRKLGDEDRDRVKDMFADLEIPDGFGVIARTAAETSNRKQELARDLGVLLKLWESIDDKAAAGPAPELLFHDQDVAVRYLREYFTTEVDEVWVDERHTHDLVLDFFTRVMPAQKRVVKRYEDYLPLFSRYDVERQIADMFSRRVKLPSGGSIVLDRTEALVAIDVNSGKVREKSVEDTALRTNMEAAREIGRQVVLRDLAGLIVVDFIDMEKASNNKKVEAELRQAFAEDKAKASFSTISKFGLMEMSRQKIRQDVYQGTFECCTHCNGIGIVRSPEFLGLEILRRVREIIARSNPGLIRVEAPLEAATMLQNRLRRTLSLWEEDRNVRIEIIGSTSITANEVRFQMEKPSADGEDQVEVLTANLWQDNENSGHDRGHDRAAERSPDRARTEEPARLHGEPEGTEAKPEGKRRRSRGRGKGKGAAAAAAAAAANAPVTEQAAPAPKPEPKPPVAAKKPAQGGGRQKAPEAQDGRPRTGGQDGRQRAAAQPAASGGGRGRQPAKTEGKPEGRSPESRAEGRSPESRAEGRSPERPAAQPRENPRNRPQDSVPLPRNPVNQEPTQPRNRPPEPRREREDDRRQVLGAESRDKRNQGNEDQAGSGLLGWLGKMLGIPDEAPEVVAPVETETRPARRPRSPRK